MRAPHRRWPLYVASLTLVCGCALDTEGRPPGPDDAPVEAGAETFDDGIAALAAGDYETASTRLGRVAAACESGSRGRRAVFLLATAALDPRNPAASPDTAARLAAHILTLPGTDPDERLAAETLYLLALDRGASPDTAAARPERPALEPPPAPRYTDCAGAGLAGDTAGASLPELPGPPAADRVERLEAARDSLARRVAELEAELERIRQLLREGILPDTTGATP